MTDMIQFMNRWLYDIEQRLRDHLEAIKDDLRSDDIEVSIAASKQAADILDWLYPPLPMLSLSARLERAVGVSQSDEFADEDREAAVGRAMRSTGRRRGRPRDKTSLLAVRALGLHLATGMSWGEIAKILKKCEHEPHLPPRQKPRRRKPNLSCDECAEAMRVAVYRLRSFLKQLGFEENVPLGKDLDEESRMELRKLWGV